MTRIKNANQCQFRRSNEIAYVDCSVPPASEVKVVRSVSDTARKINDSWPGGKLSLILFQNLFLSTGVQISLNFFCTKNFSRLEFHLCTLCCCGWHCHIWELFPID